jgi:hypothetical protein
MVVTTIYQCNKCKTILTDVEDFAGRNKYSAHCDCVMKGEKPDYRPIVEICIDSDVPGAYVKSKW